MKRAVRAGVARYKGWPLWAKIAAPLVALGAMGGVSNAVSGGNDSNAPAINLVTTIPAGAFAECKDGQFSDNTEFKSTCSSHDGVKRWLAPYVQCRDGTVVSLNKDTTCGGKRGGVDKMLSESEAAAIKSAATTTIAVTTTKPTPSTSSTSTTLATSTTRAATTTAAATTTTPAVTTTKAQVVTSPPATSPPTTNPPPRATCAASVSNPTPVKNSNVTVSITSSVPNAGASVTAHYKSTNTQKSATTNSTGSASVTYDIGGATSGYTVVVDVTVGGVASCSTSFTPV